MFLKRYLSIYKDAKEILSLFTNQYTLHVAHTDDQKAEAYRLRHKIYCQELGFIHPDEREIEVDAYDGVSTQIILNHLPSKKSVGCVRFIPGLVDGRFCPLPMENVCGNALDHDKLNAIKHSGHKYAEISRLAIDRSFRSLGRTKAGNVHSPVRASCALLALLMGVQAHANQIDTRYMLAIIEKRLWSTMAKLDIPVVPMGTEIDYRGKRFPVMIDRDAVEGIIPLLMRPLYNHMRREIVRNDLTVQTTSADALSPAHMPLVERADVSRFITY